MRTARRCCRLTRSAKRSRAASLSPARTRALMLAASSESLDVGSGWTRAGVFGAVDDTDRGSSPDLATRRGGVLIGIRRSEEHTSELQSQSNLVCRLLLEKKKKNKTLNLDMIKLITIVR